MNDLVRQNLIMLIRTHGARLIDQPKQLEGMLRDLCKESKLEIFSLINAVNQKVPADLQADGAGSDPTLIARLVQRLEDHLGFKEELARWVVESWAMALGVKLQDKHTLPDSPCSPQKNTLWKKVMIGAALVLLVGGVWFLASLFGPKSPSDVVVAAYMAANKGRFAEAESYSSTEDREALKEVFNVTKPEQMGVFWDNTTHNRTIRNIVIRKEEVNGREAEVRFLIYFKDGKVEIETRHLVKEGHEWKLSSGSTLNDEELADFIGEMLFGDDPKESENGPEQTDQATADSPSSANTISDTSSDTNTNAVETTSKGTEKAIVPVVVGKSYADAKSLIEAHKLRVDKEEAYSGAVPEGSVIAQSPSGNMNVDVNSSVTVTVSKGAERATVPSVVGKSYTEAKNLIEAEKLRVEKEEAYSRSVPRGAIISQSPSAYTKVGQNSTVTVTVSKGPERVTVPNLRGLHYTEAMNIIRRLNLFINTEMNFSNNPEGYVYEQSPDPNTQVDVGSQVTIYVSLGSAPDIGF